MGIPVSFINLPGGCIMNVPSISQLSITKNNWLVQVRGNLIKAKDVGLKEVSRE